jgi:bifunctional UDP-N-acetylglucosamine pyrophosphorylase/glucosamine-1-phosphate N-acetyltransferase
MTQTPLLVVVLAAGKGLRMQSDLPKVLHPIGGQSMLAHVLEAAAQLGPECIALVIGPDTPAVRAEASRVRPDAEIFEQPHALGTAHAVLAAQSAIRRHRGRVLVLFADSPMVEPETLRRLVGALDTSDIAVLSFKPLDPAGYGRVVVDGNGYVTAIREDKDATAEEKHITLCNAGAMAFQLRDLAAFLGRIGKANAKGEFYLTDAPALAAEDGLKTVAVACRADDATGINSREQLAVAEAIFQTRARSQAMQRGATLIAPETVWFSFDTVTGRDVTIEPNVFFGPGVVVEDGAHIMANCHMTGTRIRKGARVGPFARFRPGADIGPGARIGNFVEVKNASVEGGAKVNHLSYIGDARVGGGANIGAGTIVCNYDGFSKHRTDIGNGAFIGSNSSLVAPVKIGEGAYVGSGSVITRDVTPGALALARSPQEERPGWVAKFRQLMQRRKKTA